MADQPDEIPSVFDLMRRYGLDPKKSLGQNFLVDESHLRRIADAADLTKDDTVLEVGPGLGVLTRHLAERAGRVVAVELDDRLIPILQERFAGQPHVEIIHGDILTLDPRALVAPAIQPSDEAADMVYKVVANLPYYITSAVLRHLLEATPPPVIAVLLVQWEVARRIMAKPGDMSILAVSVQFYAEPRIIHKIPAGAFVPRPKVDSAILRLDVRPRPAVPDVNPDDFFRVVRAGFGQKRKQLLNSLSQGLSLPKETARQLLVAAGIDPRRRAETLSLDEWARLTKATVAG
jgi:16S rRNA (adenine1518-N6/adenine1519-N6)-dimethyltransferase